MRPIRRPEPSSTSEQAPPQPDVLRVLAWSEGDGLRTLATVAEVRTARTSADEKLWIDLVNPDRVLLDDLSGILGLHPLVAEDILERNQRAKVELTNDTLHVVMFALDYEGEIVSHELDIVLGPNYLLTSHDRRLDLREGPFKRRDAGRHLAGGPDYVLWALADWVVDGYFPVFDRLGDEIDDLQADVMSKPSSWIVERLFQVRRDLLHVRHAVSPQREIFNQLTNRDLTLIDSQRIIYFRDVYDHLIRLTDELDSYRELVSTTLDIYLSQINNNLSEIMKRLTAVTVVLAGVGAVAGIFGMSEAGLAFDLREGAGFWLISLATLTIAGAAAIYFRRIGWI